MKQILGAFRRTSFGTLAALFLLTIVGVALPTRDAHAAGLLFRSLELTSSQPSGITGASTVAGNAANGDKVGHTYVFQVQTNVQLNAIKIQYCDGPFGYLAFDDNTGTCTSPGGFSAGGVTAATVDVYASKADYDTNTTSQSNLAYTKDAASTTKELILVNGTGPALVANNVVKVTVAASNSNFFVNPNDAYRTDAGINKMGTFYAHIETYATSAAATGNDTANPPVDEGTVTSAVANTISINTRVQEVLKFSVEGEENETPDGPETGEGTTCDALTASGDIVMGNRSNNNALSSDRTYDAYSYFRLATNSSKGAQVLYAGNTLTSTAGDNIDAMPTTPTAPAANQEQFGIGIPEDFTSGTGNNDVQDDDTGPNELYADANYNAGLIDFDGGTPNLANGSYAFDPTSNGNPVRIAASDGIVRCDTGVVRYIANISTDTPAGLYSTKVSYIAVPSY